MPPALLLGNHVLYSTHRLPLRSMRFNITHKACHNNFFITRRDPERWRHKILQKHSLHHHPGQNAKCDSKATTHHRKSTTYYIPTKLRPANIACWNPATTCDWATIQCTSPTDCSIQLNIFSSNRTLILLLLSLLVNFTPENRSHHNFTASTRWHA